MDATNRIDCFDGEYEFLSNFHIVLVYYDGILYNCSECAFQSAKTLDKAGRLVFRDMKPGKAKREGKKLKLRADWETVKDSIMLEIVRAKFTQNPELAKKLLETGDAELIEGNYWGDNYWGVCDPSLGQNKLGKILMQVRSELKNAGNT